jgi:hypothetical protein
MQEARSYGNSTQEKLIAQQERKETLKHSRIIFVQEQFEPVPSRHRAREVVGKFIEQVAPFRQLIIIQEIVEPRTQV